MAAVTDEQADHISREAGDKQKGFRFQKLRAAIRFLQSVAANRAGQVLCAIELLEDSLLYDGEAEQLISGEENKLYDSALSFNSPPVRNTMVAFLDLYFAFHQSDELKLSVYASAGVADERISAEIRKSLGFEEKGKFFSILGDLAAAKPLSPEEKKIAQSIVLAEYRKQYKAKKGGFLSLLEAWSTDEFYAFLEQVEWSISSESNEDLEVQALELIRSSRFYNYRHEGLEEFVLSRLIDVLEKRSGLEDPLSRLVSTDKLELIFKLVLGEASLLIDKPVKPFDPAANSWEEIEVSDFRNLQEKIFSVSPEYPRKSLKILARKSSLSRCEAGASQKEYISLRRRILDVCEDELEKMALSSSLDPSEVNEIFDKLSASALSHISVLSETYQYGKKDLVGIKGAVLSLFDECFLAFDNNE